ALTPLNVFPITFTLGRGQQILVHDGRAEYAADLAQPSMGVHIAEPARRAQPIAQLDVVDLFVGDRPQPPADRAQRQPAHRTPALVERLAHLERRAIARRRRAHTSIIAASAPNGADSGVHSGG